MAKTKLIAPQVADAEAGEAPSPIVWSASIAMRADGTLEVHVKGETGHQMMKAAMDELRAIERLRKEPAYTFGRLLGSSD
ncbi:hypothetical protein BJI69_04795 [Luteibacter rhizovicinus DSM 16549]|uniref:Uncharacterized protein n=1 Tax=Luteibacter rhizovicinus DSM 16549 TaxID=1440763 RepID=A0A0G9HJ83_9GAMM|nr:hypothetical protein [Luteibacter rhizovicinus]APG03292.1 hypothetical protein BJI69_04795 [Luteibacter rhizovicinus DSM 16549]KLD67727.1 hypothetical protein Y883_06065 [Luteibacter rhizovicinus DSM 16549]